MPDEVGSMTWSPVAPAAAVTVKFSVFPLHERPRKEELFRPSTQSSICLAETIGTLRACAEATIASEPGVTALSVCMFTVKIP